MTKSREAKCTEINRENILNISETIQKERGGSVIILEIDELDMAPRVHIDLYDRPRLSIDDRGFMGISGNQGYRNIDGESWSTGYLDNRWYSIRDVSKPSTDKVCDVAKGLFESIVIGKKHQFQIHYQSCISKGITQEDTDRKFSTAFYVSRDYSLEDAFKKIISMVFDKLESAYKDHQGTKLELDQKTLDRVLSYIIYDLKTYKVVLKNIAAGMDADILLGI